MIFPANEFPCLASRERQEYTANFNGIYLLWNLKKNIYIYLFCTKFSSYTTGSLRKKKQIPKEKLSVEQPNLVIE